MPITEFSRRLVIDKYFLRWVKALSSEYSKVRYDTLKFLSIIHTSSRHCPRAHNLMLYDHFVDLSTEIPRKELSLLALPANSSAENPKDDEMSKVVKLAIAATNEKPFKATILTSESKMGDYKTNKHFQGIKEIDMFADVDAIEFVDKMFRNEYEMNK